MARSAKGGEFDAEMFERFRRAVDAAGRLGLSVETVIAACEDYGCRTLEGYTRHVEAIVGEDPIRRVLAQPGASSAMASGKFEGEGGR